MDMRYEYKLKARYHGIEKEFNVLALIPENLLQSIRFKITFDIQLFLRYVQDRTEWSFERHGDGFLKETPLDTERLDKCIVLHIEELKSEGNDMFVDFNQLIKSYIY